MKSPHPHLPSAVLAVGTMLLAPSQAAAYLGPGAGLSAIGSLLALVAAVVVALVGFIWYPLKRILGKKKQQQPDVHAATASPVASEAPRTSDPTGYDGEEKRNR